MKQVLFLILVLVLIGTGGYYQLTGQFPWAARSPEERQIADLRTDFDMVREQWKQAGRAATSGMDTSTITETPLVHLEQMEKALAELAPKLQSQEAIRKANQLRQDIAAFKRTMR